MLESLIKKCLFMLDPEQAHDLALKSLALSYQLGFNRFYSNIQSKPCQVMGLSFPNPVGLAAGFDKNADYVDALAALGFGFIEVGTITPKPQAGNSKPRLFRLTEEQAIINRMGFNNKGVDYIVERLKHTAYRGILGINIGKNRDTSLAQAVDDYVEGFRKLAPYASYVTVNISSPNTPELRKLQQGNLLIDLLSTLKNEQAKLSQQQNKYVPLVVKIAPDLSQQEIRELADIILQQHIDGIIATNTTIARNGVENSIYANESGGLSGKPLCHKSTEVVKELHSILQNKIPIIASGGVMDAKAAQEKLAAGASLIQIYSGFVFQGPTLIRDIVGVL